MSFKDGVIKLAMSWPNCLKPILSIEVFSITISSREFSSKNDIDINRIYFENNCNEVTKMYGGSKILAHTQVSIQRHKHAQKTHADTHIHAHVQMKSFKYSFVQCFNIYILNYQIQRHVEAISYLNA